MAARANLTYAVVGRGRVTAQGSAADPSLQ
jgi:hypothetical protein